MGFSFRKSIKLGRFFRLNLSSRSGIGLSTGIKGARISFTKKGVNLHGGKGIFRISKHLSFKKIFKFFK